MNHSIPNAVLFPEVKRLLDEGRDVTLTPQGVSMLPFIRGGEDSVTLRRTGTIEVGDILLVEISGIYILHRLIRRDGDALTLRGDGNIRGEEQCTTADVIGKVVAICNKQGRPKRMHKAGLWQVLYPIRRYLLKVYRVGYKLFRKFHKNNICD